MVTILWAWLFLFAFLLIIELLTTDLIVIWFAIGAVVGLVLNILGANLILQFIGFGTASLLTIFFTRPKVVNYLKKTQIKTNSNAIIGQTGIVLKQISPHQVGEIKVKNQVWSAISAETIKVGAQVYVLDIEGVKTLVQTKP